MTATGSTGLLDTLRQRLSSLLSELAKFGVVGAMAFVIDFTLFNVMLHLTDKPLSSKVVSTVTAAAFAFFLNRYWSFKDREKTGVRRESGLFILFNVIGLLIALGCLGLSHYALGFESKLADNIAANGFGLVLGTAFRFYSYHRWVWAVTDDEPAPVTVS